MVRNFLSFVQPNIHYRVHSGLPLAFVLLPISAGHILTSHTFQIHINTIVQSTIFFLKVLSWFQKFRLIFCGLISYLSRVQHC